MILKKPIMRAAIYLAALLAAIALGTAVMGEWNRAEALEATWYGPGFVGFKTASGEIFTGQDLTAASGTIPMGTVLEVTGPNGKQVPVRVNDICACPLDLAEGAAEATGVKAEGRSQVSVETVGNAAFSSSSASTATDSSASAGSSEEANRVSDDMTALPDTGAPPWVKEVVRS